MPARNQKQNGIMCLETIWFDELNSPSTRLVLELLQRLHGTPFVYRDVSTHEEMDFHLGRWVGRHTAKENYVLGNYGILYLGFHGSSGQVSLREDMTHGDDQDEMTLDQIADSLTKDARYNCSGSLVHFGACSVLRNKANVHDFKDKIGAAAVSGYKRSVYSAPSWAFELMYLSELSQRNLSNPSVLQTLQKKIESKPEYAGLADTLGFRMIV